MQSLYCLGSVVELVAGIPQQIATAMSLFTGLNLKLDVGCTVGSPVKRVVFEVLQPGTQLLRPTIQAFGGLLECVVDHFAWVLNRVPIAWNSQMIARWVYHQTHVIEMLRHLFNLLPDVGVVIVPWRISENVTREVNVVRQKFLNCSLEKGINRLNAILHVVRLGILGD